MAASIQITQVGFATPSTASTNVLFKYKKKGDVAWINLNNNLPVVVGINGVLATPINITGLLYSTIYEIYALNSCVLTPYVKEQSTPQEACPMINDITMIITA